MLRLSRLTSFHFNRLYSKFYNKLYDRFYNKFYDKFYNKLCLRFYSFFASTLALELALAFGEGVVSLSGGGVGFLFMKTFSMFTSNCNRLSFFAYLPLVP